MNTRSGVTHDSKRIFDSASRASLESRVIAANAEFYRDVTHKFDRSEPYLFDAATQRDLNEDLDQIGSHFALLGRKPVCLDCGGGTGNLALKMCSRGWTVTVVDVSDAMLSLLEEKSRAKQYHPTLIHSSLERFLAASNETYDVVSFSAVLHHLYSYVSVVQAAAWLVRPGGFFYSNHDPLVPRRPLWARALDSLDIAITKAAFDRRDLLPGVGRRLRKLLAPKDRIFDRAIVSAGDLAEYRAHTGVDDEEVIRILLSNGFTIVEHVRYPGGRSGPVRFLNRRLRLQESFKVMAWRDVGFLKSAQSERRSNSRAKDTAGTEGRNQAKGKSQWP